MKDASSLPPLCCLKKQINGTVPFSYSKVGPSDDNGLDVHDNGCLLAQRFDGEDESGKLILMCGMIM